jgi:hypothetical protein
MCLMKSMNASKKETMCNATNIATNIRWIVRVIGAYASDLYVSSQKVSTKGMNRYLFSIHHYNKKKTFNLHNLQLNVVYYLIFSSKIGKYIIPFTNDLLPNQHQLHTID